MAGCFATVRQRSSGTVTAEEEDLCALQRALCRMDNLLIHRPGVRRVQAVGAKCVTLWGIHHLIRYSILLAKLPTAAVRVVALEEELAHC